MMKSVLRNIPFLILFVLPFSAMLSIVCFQLIHWNDAKTTNTVLENVLISEARQFNPSDVRRAEITEIEVVFMDDSGVERRFSQLSPFTKYFFSYGDKLTIRYFNETEFEATIWNFSVKFYYVIVTVVYLLFSAVFIAFAHRNRRTKKKHKYKKY